MAYHATLEIESKKFDVVWCECGIRRDVDPKGRPCSDLYGGRVIIQIESTDDNTIFELMASQSKSCSGTITFTKDESDMMKELKWKNGYIIEFSEKLENIDDMPMLLTFIVSAQTLIIGDAKLEQNWSEVG